MTDLKRIEWVMEVAGGGDNVAVDANGRFDLDAALAYARAIEPLRACAGSRSLAILSTTWRTPCSARHNAMADCHG